MGARGTQPEWTPERKSGHHAQYSINQAVRDSIKFPTPLSTDYKAVQHMRDNHQNQLPAVVGGALNPTWVEWLMAWPLGWSDLKPLATDKCHYVQQQHLNC
jgi:hypothetical protein